MRPYDAIDLDLLSALTDDPRAANSLLADRLGLSRNTVHARMRRLGDEGAFLSFERQMHTGPLGYPLHAWITLQVRQSVLERVVSDLARIPEVLQAQGLSGASDILLLVACRDAGHLFEIDAAILAIEGVERAETALVMRDLIPYRVKPLVERERRRMR